MKSRMETPLAEQIPTDHFDLGPCSAYWDYRDREGTVVMRVCRWEQPGGKKDIRPVIRVGGGWSWKHHPNPRPLFQLDRLTAEPDMPVIVVEGEKAAEAAQKLYPSHIVTTWSGGAESVGKADWTPLIGRDLILIPDCDQPGRKAMEWVRETLEWVSASFPSRAGNGSLRILDPLTIVPDLPQGWDMADAIKEDRDVSRWLFDQPTTTQITAQSIEAKVFEWTDTASIAPREWIYGKHYMRGMVSATAGVGGAGKSTLLNVELVSMAIGRDLMNDGKALPLGPLTVWGHNGEDPYVELQRRLMAVCFHYGVTREDLGGRLRITSGRDMPVMLATELAQGGKLLTPTQHGSLIAAEIAKHGIQVLVLDPFVTIHRVNENDNVMIDGVMTILRDLAHSTNCAIEVAHHFRKLNGDEPSVDSIRGASSIVGAARSARVVAGMSKEDAAKYGIGEDHRGFYSWLQNGKANMLPPTHKRNWMLMTSVSLGNEREPYEADEIGVITSWTPPDCENALNPAEYNMMRRAVRDANPITHLRADIRSTGWIGALFAKVLERDATDKVVKSQMQSLIGRLISNGSLVKQEIRDSAQGRNVAVLTWRKEEAQQ